MITTVVFDLDDTLYDEIDYCRSGFKAVAEHLANKCGSPLAQAIFESLWKQFTSGQRGKIFNLALEELDISFDNQLITELVNVYRNHPPDIALPKESRDVLDMLREEFTLALLTDGFLPAQKLKVQALGLEGYCTCIIYTEDLGRDAWKPSKAGFEKLIEELNIKPEMMVYIADNAKKDFSAPNKLGSSTIQLIRPLRIHTETSNESQSKADYVIHQIRELPQLLENL
ncbi:MAG: HAD family hydrolase [Planctomycetota bacterium]|jgi:putative hydrolase of the HAD superfamily